MGPVNYSLKSLNSKNVKGQVWDNILLLFFRKRNSSCSNFNLSERLLTEICVVLFILVLLYGVVVVLCENNHRFYLWSLTCSYAIYFWNMLKVCLSGNMIDFLQFNFVDCHIIVTFAIFRYEISGFWYHNKRHMQ